MIQTDALLEPRQLRRPVAERAGPGDRRQLRGLRTGAARPANTGIGFAIPINTVRDVVAQLKAHGRVDHPLLGVLGRSVTPAMKQQFGLPVQRGVLIERIVPGSGAEQAGLRGATSQVVIAGESYRLGGDLIVKAGGQDIVSDRAPPRARLSSTSPATPSRSSSTASTSAEALKSSLVGNLHLPRSNG